MPASMPTRRCFLAASAATGLAAWSSPSRARAAAAAPLNLGIQLYSLRGFGVEEALRHARDIGFRFVEFYPGMWPINADAEAIAAMKKRLADLGLTATAHGVNRFTKDAAANRKMFEFAKAAGIRTFSADPDPDSFDSLNELVKEFDVRIAIHNHGPGHRYNKAVDVLKAVEKYDQRIGACADLGHYIRSGERPVDVIRVLAGRLYGVHLKDFAEMQDKTKGVVLGKGHIDPQAVMAALVAAKFPADGALSIEYEENPQNPIDDLKACEQVARAAIAKL
ncbi:MAG: sugar phosphate isomerase/epimerase family protein [Planctomycetia bacterium]